MVEYKILRFEEKIFIYHRTNWCSDSLEVNTYNDLANVKITPEYLTNNTYYTVPEGLTEGTYSDISLITESGSGSGAKVNVVTNTLGITSILVARFNKQTGSQGSGYNTSDIVKILASDIGGPSGLFFRLRLNSSALELDSSGNITGRLLARSSTSLTLASGNSGYYFSNLSIANGTTLTKTYERSSQTLTISGTPDPTTPLTYNIKINDNLKFYSSTTNTDTTASN